MGFSSRILLDSISPAGVRLTTMEVTFPRFVLSEFNTHRSFCLDGDTKLHFDLPCGRKNKSGTRRFTMTLRDFYQKWNEGAAPRQNNAPAALVGHKDYTAVALVTRRTNGPRIRLIREPYRIRGLDFVHWANGARMDRQPLRDRLKAMSLRSCDENTGEIHHTQIRDVCYSGKKNVFRIVLSDGKAIVSSEDHLFLTREGWQTLREAVGLELTIGGIATWRRGAEFSVSGSGAMVRHFVPFVRIEYVGVRDTYDIAVNGPFHNFVADGFIVHNSRNSASSRAIPTSKLIERVTSEPAMPVEWGRNRKGMSADQSLDVSDARDAEAAWLAARDTAVRYARAFSELKVHKQIANRVLEPFMWHTVIVTATEWENFFDLRCSPNAQPEIHKAADLMRESLAASAPSELAIGQWHLPLLQNDERELDVERQKQISVARCARVSYLTHDGTRNVSADIELFTRLKGERHLSPFEHVATPTGDATFHANFRGWIQMRKEIEEQLPHENLTELARG